MMAETAFHRCSACGVSFTLDEVLTSSELEPIGMQVVEGRKGLALFYFTHLCATCESTSTIPAHRFRDLIDEAFPPETLEGTHECAQHCLTVQDLDLCDQPCENAPFRRFLVQVMLPRKGLKKTRS